MHKSSKSFQTLDPQAPSDSPMGSTQRGRRVVWPAITATAGVLLLVSAGWIGLVGESVVSPVETHRHSRAERQAKDAGSQRGETRKPAEAHPRVRVDLQEQAHAVRQSRVRAEARARAKARLHHATEPRPSGIEAEHHGVDRTILRRREMLDDGSPSGAETARAESSRQRVQSTSTEPLSEVVSSSRDGVNRKEIPPTRVASDRARDDAGASQAPNQEVGVAHESSTVAPAEGAPAESRESSIGDDFANLPEGNAALTAPKEASVGEEFEARLLVSRRAEVAELIADLRNELKQRRQRQAISGKPGIKVSERMQAELSGRGFDISPHGPQRQPVALNERDQTEWVWSVVPRSSGERQLRLTLYTIITTPDGQEVKSKSFTHPMTITVAPWRHPIALLAAAALSVLGLGAIGLNGLRRRLEHRRTMRAPVATSACKQGVDAFVSYARADEEPVGALVAALRDAGYSVWVDQGSIEGASHWSQEIVKAIQSARMFILMSSTASLSSDNVRREVSLAVEEGRPILPVHLEPTEIPPTLRYELAGIQRIECFDVTDDYLVAKVTDAVAAIRKTSSSSDVDAADPRNQTRSRAEEQSRIPSRLPTYSLSSA